MSDIIDRRLNPPNKSGGNTKRFIKRVEGQIKKSLPDVIDKNGIKSITNSNGKVRVPIRGIKEPSFGHDPSTGNKGYVRPGNDQFVQGDKVAKPKKGGGGGKGAGKGPNYEEDFVVEISKEEFLEYFFQDLELPDMVKKFLESVDDYTIKRSGYTTAGIPARLNRQQSVKRALSRKVSVEAALSKKLEKFKKLLEEATEENKAYYQRKIDEIEKKITKIPFIDNIDLRFNNFVKEVIPTTSAVMFCLMDVSASMGREEKDIAKRFFMLLYMFLSKEYENIDIVFIRHTTEAKEVSEEEFFEGKETGGTRVASALELMDEIIEERYSNGKWNIYGCQASDGDIWSGEDDRACRQLLENDILPKCQYYSYIEIDMSDSYLSGGGLGAAYEPLVKAFPNFASKRIKSVSEIWPAFKKMFKKKNKVS